MPDDGWAALARIDGPGQRTLRAFAICAKGRSPLYTTADRSLNPGEGARVEADCPTRRHLTGTGARIDGPRPGSEIFSTFGFDSDDAREAPDDGAGVFGSVALTATAPRTETAFAVCVH